VQSESTAEMTTVAIARVAGHWADREAVLAAVENALRLVPDWAGRAAAARRILLKPNLTTDSMSWETGAVTSTLVVEAVARALREASPRARIGIAEATAVALDTKKAFVTTGLDRLARDLDLDLIDLNDDEHVAVPVEPAPGCPEFPIRQVRVCRSVLECDFLVNLPVLKTHPATAVSICLKNLKGTIPAAEKRRFHFKGLLDCVIALNRVVRPALVIADGTVGHEGDGPIGGTPVGLGLVVAGTDSTAVELISGRIMGLTLDEMPLLTKARQHRLGVCDERAIRIVGLPLAEATRPFRRAVFPFVRPPGVAVVDANACTGCREGVRMAIARAQAAGLLSRLPPLRFLIGGGDYPNEEAADEPRAAGEVAIYVGRCRQAEAKAGEALWVPGCPPQVFLIADELRALAGEPRLYGERKSFEIGEVDDPDAQA